MSNENSNLFEHLFTDSIRDAVESDAYGAWRSISAPDAVSLSFGFPYPDSLPNDELIEAGKAVFEAEGDRALQYGGGDYADRLVDVIVERARERGIECETENVLLTSGSTHALDVICQTFLEPDDLVAVEAPTFMGALSVFRNYGVSVEGFAVDENGLDVDALADDLETRRAAGRRLPTLLYAIPTFQNPTGTTLSLDRRKKLLELADEYDFVVLEDDAYGDLGFDGEDVPTLAELDETGRVLHVGTFSKTIAPGVRTGWVVAHEEITNALHTASVGGTNTFTREILGYYCTEGAFDENLAELRREYERRRDHFLGWLEEYMPPEVEWTDPGGGFFVWITFPEGVDTHEMLELAAEEGVTYLPGSMFFPEEGHNNGLRASFSYASLSELEQGIEALGRTARSVLAEQ